MNKWFCTAVCLVFLAPGGPIHGKSVTAGGAAGKEPQTVAEVIKAYGAAARARLKPEFDAADVSYPPSHMTWIALKEEKLQLCFARDRKGNWRQVLSYAIIGTSGVPGPKLKEGDKQIPEGFYKLSGFRPKIIAHIGMDVNYPNAEDRAHAKEERRSKLGGDIMIHGHYISTGCLAMGDEAIERLFVLAYDTGLSKIDLIFAPCDLTKHGPPGLGKQPLWVAPLYQRITTAMRKYPIN